MSTSYVPPAPPGAAVATIRVNGKTTLRVGPVPGRDRVWLQLTYASTFVVAVLDVDQVAQLIVGLRRAGGDSGTPARAPVCGPCLHDRHDLCFGPYRVGIACSCAHEGGAR